MIVVEAMVATIMIVVVVISMIIVVMVMVCYWIRHVDVCTLTMVSKDNSTDFVMAH